MLRSLLSIPLVLALALPSFAAIRKWTGAAGDRAWDTPANWEGGILPVDGDSLHFAVGDVSQALLNDMGTLEWVDHVWIDDGYTLTGNGIEVRGGLTVAPFVSTAVYVPLRVGQSQTWSGGGDGESRLNVTFLDPSAELTVSPVGTWWLDVTGSGRVVQTGGRVIEGPAGVATISCSLSLSPLLTVTGGELTIGKEFSPFDGRRQPPGLELWGAPCSPGGCTERAGFGGFTTVHTIDASGGVLSAAPAEVPRATTKSGSMTLGPGVVFEVPLKVLIGTRPHATFVEYRGADTRLRSPLHVGWPGDSFSCATGAGTVALNGATLDVIANERLASCTTLVIIDNDGPDAVQGTFAGLPEGATFTSASGQAFRISYAGGTGNDVTLTALDGLPHCSLAESDLTGDRGSEILWRHTSTGENSFWRFNNDDNLTFTPFALPQVVDTNWKIVASSDFDADGRADLLWRHASTGENYLWRMDGATILDTGYVNVVPDLNWTIAGTGDFNGDGMADILWRHAVTGENYLYLMNGRTITTAGPLATIPDTQWKIVGAGDLNADGRADIVWRHGTTGEIYGWLMNGFATVSSGIINYVPDPNWTIKAIADYDADRKDDILWRNIATGEIYLYLMNGTVVQHDSSVATIADLGWDVAIATNDFDGDGRADLFWRHADGTNYLYFMNGAQYTPATVPALEPVWRAVP